MLSARLLLADIECRGPDCAVGGGCHEVSAWPTPVTVTVPSSSLSDRVIHVSGDSACDDHALAADQWPQGQRQRGNEGDQQQADATCQHERQAFSKYTGG